MLVRIDVIAVGSKDHIRKEVAPQQLLLQLVKFLASQGALDVMWVTQFNTESQLGTPSEKKTGLGEA